MKANLPSNSSLRHLAITVSTLALALGLGLATAEAGTLYQSAPTSGGTVWFAPFNPASEQLTEVQFTLTGSISYAETFYNLGPATSYTLSFYTSLLLGVAGTPINAYNVEIYTGSGTVGANTGGLCRGTANITAPPLRDSSAPGDIAYFTGVNPVSLTASILGGDASCADPNIQIVAYPNFTLQGTVGLTYTYEVPEPSTLGLLAGGLVMLARRRWP